jgi:hypothetical protein
VPLAAGTPASGAAWTGGLPGEAGDTLQQGGRSSHGAALDPRAALAQADAGTSARPAEAPLGNTAALMAAVQQPADRQQTPSDGQAGTSVLQASAIAAGGVMPTVAPEAAQAAAPAHALAAAGAPPPAEQVAAAVVHIANSPDSPPQITLHLQPGELGAVQIRIERMTAGMTHIEISAAKPETLAALQNSQAQLHQSLDLAGIPAAGRNLTFHMPEATPAHMATATGVADSGGSGAGQAGTQSDGGGRGGGSGQQRHGQNGAPLEQTLPPAPADAIHSYRIGLDITA